MVPTGSLRPFHCLQKDIGPMRLIKVFG
jgi:hypothetical protein